MDYDFKGDAVYIFIPCPEIGAQFVKQQLLMTKEIFIACYEKWVKNIDNEVNALPPAEKTAKWLDIGKFTDIDGNYHEVWKCDYCGYISYDDSNFCPECGSKMVD